MPLKIYRRKGSENWYIRGTIFGQYVHESTGTGDKPSAEAIRILTESKVKKQITLGPAATLTLEDATITYLNSGGEARFIVQILDFFGPDFLISKINNEQINRAAAKLYPNAEPSTINRQLITPISAVINMAAQEQLCPPALFRRRKVTAKKMRWLTPEEFEIFLIETPLHLKPIISFMVGSGARVSETLRLDVSTTYLATGQALLSETKSNKDRMVRIPDRAVRAIKAYRVPERGPLFRTPTGTPYLIRKNTGGQLGNAFNKAKDRAIRASRNNPDLVNIVEDFTPHTLRHTWATWFYSQTKDSFKLLDLGGWADANTANIYRKVAPDDLGARLLDHGWDFRPREAINPATQLLRGVAG